MPHHIISHEAAAAACCGDVRALELYLNRNPHLVNAPTVFQSKLIHIATKTGQSEIVQLLLDLGADVGALDYGGLRRTALHWACVNGEVKIVEVLINAGADPKASGPGWKDLVNQRRCGKHVETNTPPPDAPTSLCANSHCWLALLRPEWTIELHNKFPPRFKEAVQCVLMASKERKGGVDSVFKARLDLIEDLQQIIFKRMAYPISAWIY